MSNILENIFSIKNKIDNGKSYKVIKTLGIKIKFRYDKSPLFPYKRKDKRVAAYRYVHLMNNGIHSINIINFINRYFDTSQHCFLFPSAMFDETKEGLKDLNNVFYAPITNINLNYTQKIIIHGLFDINLVKQLYRNKKYLPKTYWFIWGGDLYSAMDDKMNNYVRKNIAGILTSFDEEIYTEKYGNPKSCFDVTYPHEITETMAINLPKKNYVHIQINNSLDSTTLEMLDILSKFKDKNLRISTILSYVTVGDDVSPLEIMKRGYELFGDKFHPLIEFMPKEDFAKHLASVDIYISNQNRQQGNGNASFVCSLGHKVYVKSNTTIYKKYNSLGIRYYDTYSIPDLSWEEFCFQDKEETQKSITILKERMKDETKVRQWKEFFNA